MDFKIPFTVSSMDKLKKRSEIFKKFVKHKRSSVLNTHLQDAEMNMTREEYVAICMRSFFLTFFSVLIFVGGGLFFFGVNNAGLISVGLGILFGGFVFFSQMNYPRVYVNRKQKELERNLIPALQDIVVQLNSGVPLFSILVNISSSDYGELSNEFKKIVKKVHAGMPQMDVLDEVGEKNPSLFFRRTLWQISNGMRAGSDLSIVVKDSIRALEEEQLIQIQNYGNKLNPMIMFYMLISVILPALSITFLTILSSIVNLPESVTQMMFIALFVGVIIVQIMFLGVIKSIRPSLL